MGFHFVGAALLSVVMRGNIIASAIGTAIGHPWTFPFIWLWTHNLGTWILGRSGASQLPHERTMHYIFENFSNVFWPMLVGGVPTAIAVWFGVFWPIRAIVAQYQRQRHRRLRRKVLRRKEQDAPPLYTGQGAKEKQ
jgi:uncharacterized protein (DUF2062 family)